MGNFGAKSVGMEEAPVKFEDSINGILEKVGATSTLSLGIY